MVVKVLLLIVFFAVMIGVGVYARKHATNVNGFVLGGAGPWDRGSPPLPMGHPTSRQLYS